MIDLEHLKTVCKLGQGKDCCRYIIMDGELVCGRLKPGYKEILDKRAESGQMIAQGINCVGYGRKQQLCN